MEYFPHSSISSETSGMLDVAIPIILIIIIIITTIIITIIIRLELSG